MPKKQKKFLSILFLSGLLMLLRGLREIGKFSDSGHRK